jgi:hypothetical protein
LIIRQIEFAVASGMPPAVMNGGRTTRIVPLSGGPEAPGVTNTEQPIVTGGPGMQAPYGENDVVPFTDTVAPCNVADTPPSRVSPVLAVIEACV